MTTKILFIIGVLCFQNAGLHAMVSDSTLYKDDLTEKLRLAAQNGEVETLSELIKQGAAISGRTSNKPGDSALHFAVRYNKPQAVAVLVKAGAQFDYKNENGRSAIEMWAFFCPAVQERNMPAARALLTTVSRKEVAANITECGGKKIKETLIAKKLEVAKKYLPNASEEELSKEIDQSIVEALMQSFQPKK